MIFRTRNESISVGFKSPSLLSKMIIVCHSVSEEENTARGSFMYPPPPAHYAITSTALQRAIAPN
jgi:hypothetical protein